MSRVIRIYVAGPMTGRPEFNFPAFTSAAGQLRNAGYVVCNPAEHGADPSQPWSYYMRRDLADLLTCDAVATLDGWQRSRGASLEVFIACQLGMPVTPVTDMLRVGAA